MDSDDKATNPDPETKGATTCEHLWIALTPTTTQCELCSVIVATGREKTPDA